LSVFIKKVNEREAWREKGIFTKNVFILLQPALR